MQRIFLHQLVETNNSELALFYWDLELLNIICYFILKSGFIFRFLYSADRTPKIFGFWFHITWSYLNLLFKTYIFLEICKHIHEKKNK